MRLGRQAECYSSLLTKGGYSTCNPGGGERCQAYNLCANNSGFAIGLTDAQHSDDPILTISNGDRHDGDSTPTRSTKFRTANSFVFLIRFHASCRSFLSKLCKNFGAGRNDGSRGVGQLFSLVAAVVVVVVLLLFAGLAGAGEGAELVLVRRRNAC